MQVQPWYNLTVQCPAVLCLSVDPKSGVFRVTTNVSSGIRPLDATGEPPMRFALLNKAPCTMYQTQFFAFTQCSQLVDGTCTDHRVDP